MRLASLLGAAALAASTPAAAEVYALVEADGAVHLSDRPGAALRCIADCGFVALIAETSRRHGMDPLLVQAVVRVESGFDARAVSRKGAAGLMQLMPHTAARYGVRNRFDPRQNIDGGVRYLRDLLELFGGDLRLALAAYNAGEAAVLRFGRAVPPYPESRQYIKRVTATYDSLRTRAAP